MKKNFKKLTLFSMMVAFLFLSIEGFAIEKNNRERWTKATNKGPDKKVPGYFINLGPTGARAILEKKSFVIKYIFDKSPASGKLKINDVITGVNGKAFETAHVFGHHMTRMDEFPDVGYEGPLMDFGKAIEDSETKDGSLVLSVQRKNKQIKVTIKLNKLGKFSASYPSDCKKSEVIAKNAIDYLASSKHLGKGPCHEKAMCTLALLSAGKIEAAKKIIYKWLKIPTRGIWVWPSSYQSIVLSEYYLITKDKKVLPTIKGIANLLEIAQVDDMKNYKDRTHGKMGNVGHKFRTGGFGHNTRVGGYGTMLITTALALTAWELAKECGIEVDQKKVDLAFSYLRKSTVKKTGYIGYHTERGHYSPSGRQGLAIIATRLAGDTKVNNDYIKLAAKGLCLSKKYVNDAHADNILGLSWGLLGANVSLNKKAIRAMNDYNKAWLNMARSYDGSFATLPGRDMYDSGYYISSRLHLTAVAYLLYSMEKPNLKIFGRK